jgi:hypothetical protein
LNHAPPPGLRQREIDGAFVRLPVREKAAQSLMEASVAMVRAAAFDAKNA